MTGLTRGPLPAEVYWRRRLAFLSVVVLLVLVIAKLMPGGGHAPKATDVAHVTQPTHGASSGTTPAADPTGAASSTTADVIQSPTPTPTVSSSPPTPTAVCSDDDISVVPSVTDAQATKPVVITLAISSITTPACLWDVSPSTLQLKITSGSDRIWSTLDCPKAVPNQRVVVQRSVPTDVNIRWNTRRSDSGCPAQTQWAMPGSYHVAVAALGGQPDNLQFALSKPTAAPPSALPSAVTTPGATASTSTAPAGTAPAAPETAPASPPSSNTVPSRHIRKGVKAD